MKFTIRQLADDFRHQLVSRLFFCLVTEHTPGNRWGKVFGIKDNESEVELKVTFNGVEVPFESFVQRLEEQHNRMLEEKAKEMMDNKMGEIMSSMEHLKVVMDDAVQFAEEETYGTKRKKKT